MIDHIYCNKYILIFFFNYKLFSQNSKLLEKNDKLIKESTEAPKFITQVKNFQLCDGQKVLLECEFTPADDPNLKIAWLLNGKALLPSTRIKTIINSNLATLEINPITVFDHGEYTIVAVNTLGEARHTFLIEVIGNFFL